MAPKEIKTRQEDRGAAVDYLKKAKDSHSQMQISLASANWNAAAVLAIQCAISSADALCVFEKGVRSISGDHFDVCEMISSLGFDGAQDKAKTLRKIIAKKNMVQYERRNVFETEAGDMVKLAARFYEWAQTKIRP